MKAPELLSKRFFAVCSIEDLGTENSTNEIHDL